MSFKSIHTSYGLARLASAEATGTPINLTHMAVGDGNGNPTTPAESQTGLVREMYRATVNRVYQDPVDARLFTAELVVPASVSGFTMREVGVFDAAGGLFAVGNLPDTYKPTEADGAFSDAVIRLQFYVSNASVITLQIDANVATASHAWVLNTITPCYLFPGGNTGQVLRKKSNGCGDTEWADPTDVSVSVNSVEEIQTLAASQTVVNWSTINNTGVSVYIEGVRLRGDQFTKHPTINTRITLSQSWPAGTKIVGVQNEPAGTLVDPLAKAQNLADVPDKGAARTNLDVYSKAEADASGQPGDIKYTGRTTAPSGWLKANGAAVSRTAYASLFAAIGTTFGAGDGVNTFNLPDLRGEFIRGLDDGRGVDSGRVIGSAQGDQNKAHGHSITDTGMFFLRSGSGGQGVGLGTSYTGLNGYPTLSVEGGSEARPRNVALLACIKF